MASPSVSPSKGKAKETTHWRTGWWDFYPLVERPKRPIQWSNSSVIFTAHPTQPRLTARHFSSSKQFAVPSPAKITANTTSYEPPTVICVAPGDDHLFAYFPSRDGGGEGCVWKRGTQLDSWTIKESWSLPRGGGIVTATFLAPPREWTVDSSGTAFRQPPRGPVNPVTYVASPTLFLITQDHQAHLCYFRFYITSLKMLRTSMSFPRVAAERHPVPPIDEPANGPSGSRICTDASIALGYTETSILIAMHSRRIPPTPASRPVPEFDAMSLDGPVDLPQSSSDTRSPAWDTWGEESSIDLCEIQLLFDGLVMGLAVNPLPSIQQPRTGLSDLTLICTPAPRPSLPLDSTRSPAMQRGNNLERGKIYLAASYLDFDDFTSIPKSELVVYSIARQLPNPANKMENVRPKWTYHQEAARQFSPGVLSFFAPSVSDTRRNIIYAGVLDTSGTLPKGSPKVKETPVGTVKVLNLPDLNDAEDWEYSALQSPIDKAGQEFPIRAILSPNHALLCSISSALWPVGMSIHNLPKPHRNPMGGAEPHLSVVLASAVLGRKAASDVAHLLAAPSSSLDETVDTLYHAFQILDRHDNGLTYCWAWDILGIAVEVYKALAKGASNDTERQALTARWETAHDICSLAACNMVFEDCMEGESYDLDAMWQLTGLCTWIVSFVQRLMKESVLFCDVSDPQSQISAPAFLHPLESPVLLHLVHPYALQNLFAALRHVKKYRAFVGSLSARGENAQIARDVLIDLIDRCGVDIKALDAILEEVVRDSRTLEPEDCRRALVSCRPTPAMRAHLSKAMKKLTQSSTLDKATLFIKPMDLVDGVARLSIDTSRKEKTKDIVTKGTLASPGTAWVCLRCRGTSEVGSELASPSQISVRWRNWAKVWTLRCICGGPWLSAEAR